MQVYYVSSAAQMPCACLNVQMLVPCTILRRPGLPGANGTGVVPASRGHRFSSQDQAHCGEALAGLQWARLLAGPALWKVSVAQKTVGQVPQPPYDVIN